MSALTDNSEIDRLQQHIHALQRGELEESRFVPLRLQQGVYGQRQADVQMLRIRIPGGELNARQLEAVTLAIKQYSARNVAHLTTRQDIQLYDIKLSIVPEVLRLLASVGLTTREACGNTVRNITACALAGACPHEHADIRHYVNSTTKQLLRHPLTQHLPRKFKISFSGCEADCAQGLIHDLAVIATWKDGVPGFKLLAAGGLGHKPRKAILLETFIVAAQLPQHIEAVLWVHNRYSDRRLRARSRLKFLVDQYGEEGFIKRYKQALVRIIRRIDSVSQENVIWKNSQKRPPAFRANDYGLYPIQMNENSRVIAPVYVPLGDLSVDQFQGIVRLMDEYGLDGIRITQDQNLLLMGVRKKDRLSINEHLNNIGISGDFNTAIGAEVVACPGTSTCRLGITSSKGLAKRLASSASDIRVHIAGCQNGCAQPEVADIGLYGEGKRMHGYLIPFYQSWIGGRGHWGEEFAIKGPSVPAQRAEKFVQSIRQSFAVTKNQQESFYQWSRRQAQEFFQQIVDDFPLITADNVASFAVDVTEVEQKGIRFKVEQFGGGECAGIADEMIDACLSELHFEQGCRDTYIKLGDRQEVMHSLNNMLTVCAGIALLGFADVTDKKQRKKLQNERELWLLRLSNTSSDQRLIQELKEFWRKFQELSLEMNDEIIVFSGEFERWLQRSFNKQTIETLLDEQGDARGKHSQEVDKVIDLSDYACPMHYLKARKHLQLVEKGAVSVFLFVSGDPAQQAIDSLIKDGHRVSEGSQQGQKTLVQVEKL